MSNNRFSRRDLLKGGVAVGSGLAFANIMGFIDYRRTVAQSQPINAAMSSAGLAGSWNAQGQDAALYWARLLGVNVTWFDGEFDPVKQRAKFDDMATQKWDFMAVQPNTIGTLVEPIQAMISAGTVAIGMDTLVAPLDQMQQMGFLTFIAPSNLFMAVSVMNKLVAKMGGKGKISHIGGQPGHTGAQARGQGFLNVLANYPDIQVVDDQPGNWSVSEAAALTESALNRNPDLNAIFADNDDMALAARQVVETAGLGDQVLVGGVDAMPGALQAITDGKLVATARNPACRIHGWAVVAGAYAATVGIEQARKDVPFFILADGPAVDGDIDSNPAFADAPWKRMNFGLSTIAGQIWAESQFVL